MTVLPPRWQAKETRLEALMYVAENAPVEYSDVEEDPEADFDTKTLDRLLLNYDAYEVDGRTVGMPLVAKYRDPDTGNYAFALSPTGEEAVEEVRGFYAEDGAPV